MLKNVRMKTELTKNMMQEWARFTALMNPFIE
jgi:hypothetical protein